MTTKKAPETDIELVNAFGDLFSELKIESVEEANILLRAAGHDPDAMAKQFLGIIDQTLATSPLNWRTQQSRLTRARDKLNSIRKWRYSRSELDAAVQELLSLLPQSQPLAAHYRNFQEMTDEDLNTWLDELAFLVDTSQEPDEE